MDKARILDADGNEHSFDNVVSVEHDEDEGEIRVRLALEGSEHATKYEFIEPGRIEWVH